MLARRGSADSAAKPRVWRVRREDESRLPHSAIHLHAFTRHTAWPLRGRPVEPLRAVCV